MDSSNIEGWISPPDYNGITAAIGSKLTDENTADEVHLKY